MKKGRKDYDQLAEKILDLVGGKENIAHVAHCATRLRINAKDLGLIQKEEIKKLDVVGVQMSGEQLQVIIGNEINEVYDAFIKAAGVRSEKQIDENLDGDLKKKKITAKSLFQGMLNGIVNALVPVIPILICSGLIQAITLILTKFGILATDAPTVVTLTYIANAAFYFLPVIVGVFAAKNFGASPALAMMLCAILIHPTFVEMVNAGDAGSIFGLKIYAAGYSSTILPAILSVWVMSKIEKFMTKHIHKSVRVVLSPVLTMLISAPLMLVVIAPIGARLSSGFASLMVWSYNTFGLFSAAVIGALIPFIIMTGMHVGTVVIGTEELLAVGKMRICAPEFVLANFTQGAACLAVGVKTKNTKRKAVALSSAFSDIVPGVSEPGIYGVTLKYRTPMIGAMVGSAVASVICYLMDVGQYVNGPGSLFGLAYFIGGDGKDFIWMLISVAVGMIIAFAVTFTIYNDNAADTIDNNEIES